MKSLSKEEFIQNFLQSEDKAEITNEDRLSFILLTFYQLLQENKIIDNNGSKTIEILNWTCSKLNPWQPILKFKDKQTSVEYCKAELEWYLSQDLSVDVIGEKAKIWKQICSSDNKINSNYGWCIFSDENYNQYQHVLDELIKSPLSRRAMMIFTRPSMWIDYNKNNMNDFICTWGVHVFIRDNKLYYIVNQRSCDFWFGFRNDFVFHCFVYQMLYKDLLFNGINLDYSKDGIFYNCDTVHLYERHFNILKQIAL